MYTARFTEKQRDLLILKPLRKSVCRPYPQRQQDRIKQHVSKYVCSSSSLQKRILPARQCKSSNQPKTQSLASDFTVELHILQNPVFAQHYDDSRLSILAQGRSPFHLSALEIIFIKTFNPAFCLQKKFVDSLKFLQCTNDAL